MANAKITKRWWEKRSNQFELFISQVVITEAEKGDQEIAIKRQELLKNIPILKLNESVRDLGMEFLKQSNLPPKASDYAIHIAVATVYRMDYLLTWNCKHVANAQIQRKLAKICSNFRYKLPTICTPDELMED